MDDIVAFDIWLSSLDDDFAERVLDSLEEAEMLGLASPPSPCGEEG